MPSRPGGARRPAYLWVAQEQQQQGGGQLHAGGRDRGDVLGDQPHRDHRGGPSQPGRRGQRGLRGERGDRQHQAQVGGPGEGRGHPLGHPVPHGAAEVRRVQAVQQQVAPEHGRRVEGGVVRGDRLQHRAEQHRPQHLREHLGEARGPERALHRPRDRLQRHARQDQVPGAPRGGGLRNAPREQGDDPVADRAHDGRAPGRLRRPHATGLTQAVFK